MNFLKTCIFMLIFVASVSNPAYAYLDPGSVSLALQAFVAALAGAALTWKFWWSRVKSWFGRLFKFLHLNRKQTSQSEDSEFGSQTSRDESDHTPNV